MSIKSSFGILLSLIFPFLLYSAVVRFLSPWNEKAPTLAEGQKKLPVFDKPGNIIWMHCASLGEFEQGKAIAGNNKKSIPILPGGTGFSPAVYEVQKNYRGRLYFYLFTDNILNTKNFADRLDPALVIWVKYEYTGIITCKDWRTANIPVLLVSGISGKRAAFLCVVWWYLEKRCWVVFSILFVWDEGSLKLLASGVSIMC